MDPTPYSSTVYRFVWDVVENFADFSDGEGLERVLEDGVFGRAWNRSHGALEILVANELDKEEVEETLEDHLGKGWRDTVVVLVLKEEQKGESRLSPGVLFRKLLTLSVLAPLSASRWTRLSNDERALKTALLDVSLSSCRCLESFQTDMASSSFFCRCTEDLDLSSFTNGDRSVGRVRSSFIVHIARSKLFRVLLACT